MMPQQREKAAPGGSGAPARHLSNSTASTSASAQDANVDLEKQDRQAGGPSVRASEVHVRTSSDRDNGDVLPAEKLMTWWQAAFYMIAYNISIGILALPKAFSDLGLAGGLVYILPYAAINYYTSKTVWHVTQRYGNVYSYPDILGLIFGRSGKWLGHVIQSLLQGFLMAVHVMAMRKALVAISAPQFVVCGVVWTFLGATVMFACSLFRNLKDCAWLAMASCTSILVATVITAVSVVNNGSGISDHFFFLPDRMLSASHLGSGISSIVFAFTGHLAYPQFISEMEKPEQFPRALKANAIVQVTMYTAAACIIYWFAGDSVKAPALDSAAGLLAKFAWGFALPTVIVAGVLPGMMIIKNANRGFWSWRNQPRVPWENSWRARGSWTIIAAILWSIAPIFAEVVPSFMGVVGVAGAFLGAWISLGFPALAWFRIDRRIPHRQRASSKGSEASDLPTMKAGEDPRSGGDQRPSGARADFCRIARLNARQYPMMGIFNCFLFVLGTFLCIFGAFGAISDMARTQHSAQALKPFACAAPAVL